MERMQKRLYDASVEGNLTVLIMLLQEDPLILDRVTLNRYGDMPLHIASMLGHTEFVKEILARKPLLAMEPDLQRRLPLHIASAKGHVELVRALLSASTETCLACDCDGNNPLHLAAIKGRSDVVKELVQARPHAARAIVQQETILHLCVNHNQSEILKFLIETTGDDEFVSFKDSQGNNILHLAVVYRQTETINFLLLSTTIQVNEENSSGETPMDILGQGPKDLKYQQILQSLTRAGAVEAKIGNLFRQDPQSSRNEIGVDGLDDYNKRQASPFYLKETSKNSDDWLDKKRNTLMVMASLIATMAFQAGSNPPGGVWQEGTREDPNIKAGYAIMATTHPLEYQIFLVCNTVGFVSSLSIILLLISGLPFLKHRFFLWILMVIMWIAATSMSATYSIFIWLLSPKAESNTFRNVVICIVLVWIGLMTLLVVGHIIRLIAIAVRILRRLLFPKKRPILRPTIRNQDGM
ncbi:unnamed protein product [Lactuca saligna]|uniref:PGG domain-containing protein n=1 Tax=Lactuca saligna TaxID=75948 RepID=A0AA35Z496_LACSI|nr:unnamed protein product [Lactuca saligna]